MQHRGATKKMDMTLKRAKKTTSNGVKMKAEAHLGAKIMRKNVL